MTSHSAPGVYIDELGAAPNSPVAIPTAVAAFVGYTPRAEANGVSYANKPVRIRSFAEFQAIFCLPDPAPPADPARQFHPQYALVAQSTPPTVGASLLIDGQYYAVLPDPSTIYYLYNAVRWFFLNGGNDAWIVSVGTYGPASGQFQTAPGLPMVNPNVVLSDLLKGFALLEQESSPTLYACPDATLLSDRANASLMQAMMGQAQQMGTAICLFDVINGHQPDPTRYVDDIARFRDSTGTADLDYGACYYPFVGTDVIADQELDFTNLFNGDIAELAPLLDSPALPNPAARAILQQIQHPANPPLANSVLQRQLLAASETYVQIMSQVLETANLLPPSAAMAGAYTVNDASNGVWSAPANIGLVSAIRLPIRLTDEQQAGLNVDPLTGKSINAIREFSGRGILVWGARTLDGDSEDWRYIQVRRALIYIKSSIAAVLNRYAFESNDGNTWVAVQSEIAAFLTGLWQQGGLQGAQASDAFTVSVGLGTTMTGQDILDGVMRVQVTVAVVHPAEFIALGFVQSMATAS